MTSFIKEKPLIEVYNGQRYNPRARKHIKVTVKRALCGVCGNPINPMDDRRFCTACHNYIDWGKFLSVEYFKLIRGLKGTTKLIFRCYEEVDDVKRM